jgi:SIR2-like domain
MSDLWDAVEAAATKAKTDEIVALIPNAKDLNKNIEKLLTLCKIYVTLFDDDNSKKIAKFVEVAEIAILARVNFVNKETDISSHRAVVRKIARRGIRKPRTKIFTTNYDLCFEYAALQQQFVVVDGFSHSMPQSYDRAHFSYDIVRREGANDAPDYIENIFHLYKLHGSLDWRRSGATIVRSLGPADGDPVLIYPRNSKYQEAFETPYLDLMGAFQSAIRAPDTSLIISGFGFNDDHISKPIMAAVEANMSLRVIICDISFIDEATLAPNPTIVPTEPLPDKDRNFFQKFRRLAELGDSRITLLNGRFQDLAAALPDLVAQTERERHADRLMNLHDIGKGPVKP